MPSFPVPNLSRLKIENYLDKSYSNGIAEDVLKGLTSLQKSIPSKYFYDARGSQLFEEICMLPEYYQTRTELSILQNDSNTIMDSFQKGDLIEIGSGANWKIRILLDAINENTLKNIRYVPVDVSEKALVSASEELIEIYPQLKVFGLVADFLHHIDVIPDYSFKLIVFFGSTIGNFDEEESITFLKDIALTMNHGDQFLLGFDMIKSIGVLEAAYNDSQGITEEFNKNILNVINKELDANFNLSHFDHIAFFNHEEERVEMHLRANRKIYVEISDLETGVEFDDGESIHTEICRKFTMESIKKMLSEAGLKIMESFSDPKRWFTLVKATLQD